MPIFEIPEDLTVFTVAALNSKISQATTEYNTLLASMQSDPSMQTDENLDALDELKQFASDAQTEIKGRTTNASRLATHASMGDAPEEEEDAEGEDEDDAAETEEHAVTTPRVGQVAAHSQPLEGEIVNTVKNVDTVYGKMYAAGNVPDFSAGQELKDLGELTKAFLSKVKTFGGLAALGRSTEPVTYQVATLNRDYPDELSVFNREEDDATLRRVIDEARLPGGNLLESVANRRKQIQAEQPGRDSMVAATGWCAPSETLYDTCFQGSNDGLYDAPEVQARRGGIRHNQGIDFTGVFGAGTGFFNLSEAQVIAGTTKSCVEIPCPSFVDDRLGVTGLCITGNILQNKGYPEFVRDWMRAAMIASAHQINSLQIAAVVAGSTAVDLTTTAPTFMTDGTVTSQLLAAVEMAIVDMKYRLRMQRSSTLEVVFPWWVLAQFRADLSRQNGGDALDRQAVSDEQIVRWFTLRGARVQWVYDWQDAFAPADVIGAVNGNAPGATTAIKGFPTGVKFLVYPSGTWVRAVNDVITLNAIYDSTKLATNQNTQLFTETGWAMMRMCPLSRVYTINICPSGNTGDQRAVDCAILP